MKLKKVLIGLALFAVTLSLTACTSKKNDNKNEVPEQNDKPTDNHTHDYDSSYIKDENSHWQKCKTCEATTTKANHTYGDWTVTKEATEKETGSRQKVCSACGYALIEVIEVLPHTHKYETSYTYDDNNHWFSATCEHTLERKDQEAHTYGEWTVTKAATEEAVGAKERICSVCFYVYVETIPQLPHTHKFATTYTYDETNHWYAATCEHSDEKKDVTTHTYGEWTVTKAATEEAVGAKQRACSVCGYIETETIPQLPHTHRYGDWVIEFNNHYKECSCGEKTSFEAHTYVDGKCTKCEDRESFVYTLLDDGTYSIKAIRTDLKGSIVIPSTHEGKAITEIGASAFENCKELTNVTIPNTVTTIGSRAFYGCYNITSLTIPSAVTTIGNNAFYLCYRLVEVINLSSLTLTKGEEANGRVAYYALNVKTSGESEIITKGDFIFYFADSKYYLFKYTGNETEVVLPDSINDNLYDIHNYLFYRNENITSVAIPDCVTSIGNLAFYGCSKLKTVTLPKNLTSISTATFYNCTSLTNITIPNTVTTIGNNAFYSCQNLLSITIPAAVTSIGTTAFEGCYRLVEVINLSSISMTKGENANGKVAYFALNVKTSGQSEIITNGDFKFYCVDSKYYLVNYTGNDTKIVLPNNINDSSYDINQYIFYNNKNITSVTIPDSVTDIGKYAFYGCEKLTTVTLPNNLTAINGSVFCNCTSLTNITIPSTVTSIDSYAFFYCRAITSITLPETLTTLGNSSFAGCSNILTITLPKTLTSIGNSAFDACFKLVEVINLSGITLNKGQTSNGQVARYALNVKKSGESEIITSGDFKFYCADSKYYLINYIGNDTKIVLPNNINDNPYDIYKYLFYNNKNVTSVKLPDGITSIGYRAFENCANLTSINLPNSITSIGAEAFYGCEKLTNVTLPTNLTYLGEYAFTSCHGLTSIVIPDGVTSIGKLAFYNCDALTSITLPANLISIGDCAFKYCKSLTSIIIPKTVTGIGSEALASCDKLTDIYFTGTEAEWNAITKADNSISSTVIIHYNYVSK